MKLKIKHVCYTFQLKYVLQQEEKCCHKWGLTDAPKRQQLELSNVIKPFTLKPQEICVLAGVMQVIFIFFFFALYSTWFMEGLTKHFKLFELIWPRTKSPLNRMVKNGEDWNGWQFRPRIWEI